MRFTHSHQPQPRRRIVNRTLDNQRFYRAAIFAAISIEFPVIAIGMRFDLRKPDACAAYRTQIFRSCAKRYILKIHELSLHSRCATNNRIKPLTRAALRMGLQISAAISGGWRSGGVTIELAGPRSVFFLPRRHSGCVGGTRRPARSQFFLEQSHLPLVCPLPASRASL